jgi:hypothetical protein
MQKYWNARENIFLLFTVPSEFKMNLITFVTSAFISSSNKKTDMKVLSILSVLIILSFTTVRCNHLGKRVNGNGNVTTQKRTVSDFSGVQVAGPYTVYVTQGDQYSVEVKADENLHEYIDIYEQGGKLKIGQRRGYTLSWRNTIEVHITAPRFKELSVAGSGKIQSRSTLTGEKIRASVSGSGNILLDVDAPEIATDIAGSGNIVIKGRTRNQDADIAGSGELHAFDLLAENAKLDISGSGDAEVFASKSLDIRIAGAGNVDYKGNPSIKKSIAGSGDINKAD